MTRIGRYPNSMIKKLQQIVTEYKPNKIIDFGT